MHPDGANGQHNAGVTHIIVGACPNLPHTRLRRMDRAMARDPATAAYAWARYRRVMRWLLAVTVALMVVALRLAVQHAGHASIRRYVVAALCVGLAMLVSSTGMGLWFLSRRRAAGDNPPPAPRQSDAPE